MTWPTQSNERRALAFGLCAVLLWSSVATGFKLGLAVLASEQLLLVGTAISWAVFLCAVVWQRGLHMSRRDFRLALMLGLLNPWAYYLVLFAAYERLPAHIAQPLNYTWAITMALLAVPLLRQKLTARSASGILTSYAGVLALLGFSASAEAAGTAELDPLGISLALFSTLLWALYWLLNTKSQCSPASMMFVSFSVGLVLVFATCIYGPGLPVLDGQTLFYGVWVGLVEMGVTFLLWQHALRRTANTAKIGQLIFLAPFISLVPIYLVLGEQITIGAIGSLIVIVAGIMISQHSPMRHS